MDSMSPKSPEQSEKNKKYDRQLRLWGDHGQQALESAHICVLNATSLGTEILKSLVLPGIGSFTIIDGGKVQEEDVGANFFLDMESIGKSRAEVAAQFLLELNPDVHGDVIDESLLQILNNNPSFFNNFSVVVGTSLSEHEIGLLSSKLWDLNIPLIICRSYGFTGMARLQVKEHMVIESRPDNQNPDLRIIQPFAALKEHLDSYDLDSMELKDHAHVPYVVILYKCIQEYYQINGKHPQNYKEKESFKELIKKKMKLDDNGIPHHEENFEEALRAVNFAISSAPISNEIENILNDDKCVNLTVNSEPFWIMARALKDFLEKEKYLPVRGILPDMTAETKSYVNLQQIYREKASKDADSVYKRAQQLLRQLNQTPDLISEQDVKLFCKHASDLRILRSSFIESEYKDRVYNSSYIASQLEDPDCMMDFYVILRSIERFYTEFKEYPGELDDHVEPDIVKLKTCLSKLLAEIGCGGAIKDDVIHEFCRYGGAELHTVSAFLGGCIAHEIIKLVTRKLLRKYNSECYAQNIKFIVRQIKEKHLDTKFVLDSIKNTFHDRNHYVGRFSCVILSTCVETCGLDMNESRTRNEYLKEMKREILKCPHPDIKIQALITLQKWEHCYGQYSIFEKGERYCFDGGERVGTEGDSKKCRERKKRARNGSIRKPKTPYQLYMKIKTQMLYGAKKGLHMKRKDATSNSR